MSRPKVAYKEGKKTRSTLHPTAGGFVLGKAEDKQLPPDLVGTVQTWRERNALIDEELSQQGVKATLRDLKTLDNEDELLAAIWGIDSTTEALLDEAALHRFKTLNPSAAKSFTPDALRAANDLRNVAEIANDLRELAQLALRKIPVAVGGRPGSAKLDAAFAEQIAQWWLEHKGVPKVPRKPAAAPSFKDYAINMFLLAGRGIQRSDGLYPLKDLSKILHTAVRAVMNRPKRARNNRSGRQSRSG